MALYHKYRPQNFRDIIGQEHIKQTLTNQIKNDNFAHAYLFSGPRGIGKTTTARILAKSLNCPKEEGSEFEPDDSSKQAQEINNSSSIDVIEIDAASHTGVQNVRDQIIENAKFKPTKLDYKVFIIDEVHMLSKSAFNALLKTLEEPPEHVVFVLATTEPHELPDTIISRCQRFDFQKITYETLKQHLQTIADKEDVDVTDDILNRIIDKSDGCVRDAISLLDQLIAASDGEINEKSASIVLPKTNNEDSVNFLDKIINNKIKESLSHLNDLANSGVNMVEFALNNIEMLRYMMVKKSKADSTQAGIDFDQQTKSKLDQLIKEIKYGQIVDLIDLFLKRKKEVKTAPIPQLPLELLVLEYCNENKDQKANKESDNQTKTKNKPTPNKQSKKKEKNTDKTKKSKSKKEQTTKTKREKKGGQTKKEDSNINIDIESIKSKWNRFLKEVETLSPSLVFILKMASILDVKGDTIKLKVKYDFHKEKLNQNNNKKKLEQAFNNITDKKVTVKITSKASSNNDNDIGELASAIGGEVIN